MINKLGNAILKDLGEYVKKIRFENREPLTIEYLPLEYTEEFIDGQSFLYNFLKEEFLDKFRNNYKFIYLTLNFEINNISVIKTDEIKNYKIDNEKLNFKLTSIVPNKYVKGKTELIFNEVGKDEIDLEEIDKI